PRAERKPGTPRTARAGPPGTRSTPATALADTGREAVPPDTVRRSAPHIYAVGGKTPAPRCRVIPRAERKSGTQGTARAGPPGARSTPGAPVADPGREAVPPDTVGRRAPHIYAVGGKTPAPRYRVIPRAERKSGTPGTARAGPPGARSTPGAAVTDPGGEAVRPDTVGGTASRTYTVTGKTPAP